MTGLTQRKPGKATKERRFSQLPCFLFSGHGIATPRTALATLLLSLPLLFTLTSGCSSRTSPSTSGSATANAQHEDVSSASPVLPPQSTDTPAPSASQVASASTPEPKASLGPIATLLEEAKLNHDKYEHVSISIEGLYVKTSTRRFGTGEHVHYTSGVIWLVDSKDDLDHELPCDVANGWPPVDLTVYERVRVEGIATMGEWLRGGVGLPGDKLKLEMCKITRQ